MTKSAKDLKDAFFYAVIAGKTHRVGKFIDKNPELANSLRQGVTPLQVAVSYGQKGVARRLLERGAKVNTPSEVKDNWTALHMAASELNSDMVALLLKHGADINAKTKDQRTARDVAIGQCSEEEIEFFLSKNRGPTIIESWVREIYHDQKKMLRSLSPPAL